MVRRLHGEGTTWRGEKIVRGLYGGVDYMIKVLDAEETTW